MPWEVLVTTNQDALNAAEAKGKTPPSRNVEARRFQHARGFVDKDGITRPRNWLTLATVSDLVSIGAWTIDEDSYDDANYTGTPVDVYDVATATKRTTFTLTPRTTVDLKNDEVVLRVKAYAGSLISASLPSWMVEREVSGGTPIPQTIKDYCQAVRDASGIIETEVKALRSYDNLVAYDIAVNSAWPTPLGV